MYSPSYAQGLEIKLDWWNIEIKDASSTPSVAYILDQCYAQGDQSYCSLFSRRANDRQIDQMLLGPQNLSKINAEDYDLDVFYCTGDTAYGRLSVGLNASYMSKWESQFSPDSDVESVVGRYFDRDPQWCLRGNATLDWSKDNLGITRISR